MAEVKNIREIWIDYAKVIGIILVIAGHLTFADNGAKRFIFAFHMPLFFFISGYLHRSGDSISAGVKKDVQRLLLPYVYFYLISYVLWFAANFLKHRHDGLNTVIHDGIVKPMLGMLLGVGYETDISLSVNHPVWFLVGLFVVKLIYTGLEKLCKGNKLYIATGLAVLTGIMVWLKLLGTDLWFSVDSAILALPFLFAGVLVKVYGNIKLWFKNNLLNLFYFAVLAFATAGVIYFNGGSDVNGTNWGNNLALFYIGGLTGSFMIFAISFVLGQYPNKFILFVSANTLVLLGTQVEVKSIAVSGLNAVGYKLPEKLDGTQVVVITLAVLILSLPVMYIIDKYFPFLSGGNKKGKPTLIVAGKNEL